MSQARTPERRSEWKFLITDDGWQWAVTRPDGTEQRSDSSFQTLKDCGDEAIQHGFGAWKSNERRRIRALTASLDERIR